MMNAPQSKLAELEDLLPGLESPSIIPLAHEACGHPLGSRGGPSMGAVAETQGCRRVRHPDPTDREARSMTATVTLRRLELARAPFDPAVATEVKALFRRGAVPDPLVRQSARDILAAVKAGGDAAVREANRRHGGGRAGGSLLVTRAEMEAARDALPPRIRPAWRR